MSMPNTSPRTINKFIFRALLLICIFLAAANFSTWKANITSPGNLSNSALGHLAKSIFTQSTNPVTTSEPSLNKDDLVGRIVIPKTRQAYLTLPTPDSASTLGNIDEFRRTASGWTLRGWVALQDSAERPDFVLIVEGGNVVSALKVGERRPDVANALNREDTLVSGYSGQITNLPTPEKCNFTLYALSSSLKLYPMPNACDKANYSTH